MNEKNIENRTCKQCGDIFIINIKNKRSYNRKFCCSFCAKKNNGLRNKGKVRSEEFKNTLSIKNTCENNPIYGKKHTVKSVNKMSLSSQWCEDKYIFCDITELEYEILDGIMISDGHFDHSRISARMTLGFKYKETLQRIITDLPNINFLDIWKYENIDKRTKNKYINYHTKTNSYRNLYFEYDRWYKNGIKIIPEDFRLTKLSCYWWYVCDGYVSRDIIYLCTDNFDEIELNKLSIKFKNIGFKNSITKNNRIRFFKKDGFDFLEWISNNINIQKEYLYKWYIKNKK